MRDQAEMLAEAVSVFRLAEQQYQAHAAPPVRRLIAA
jgi:methyl-accepting chemotaxis protein